MSLTCYEAIGRVERVGRGCYEDPRKDVHKKSCVSGPWNLKNNTYDGQQHYTTEDWGPTNQVSAWQVERRSRRTPRHPRKDHEDISVLGVSARMLYEETASVEFKLIPRSLDSDSTIVLLQQRPILNRVSDRPISVSYTHLTLPTILRV